MNKLLLLLLCGATLCAQTAKRGRDAIVFRNGDTLFGSLEAINQQDGIRWTRGDAAGDFLFTPELVSEMALAAPQPPPNPLSSNLCTIQLSNGDQLQGLLSSFDGEKAIFETWYGGTMEISKNALALLVPLGLPKPILFEGPRGLEGWTMGRVNPGVNAAIADSGQWHFHKEALYAVKAASIARDIHLPESASLQFDLEWRGFFNVAIALYTQYLHPVALANKETEPPFGGFYSLQLNPFSANLLPVKQFDALRYLGQAPLQNLAQKSSAHFDIRVSKQKRLIALLIDGVVVKQWIDTDPEFAGTGTAVRFVHQGQGAVKLTNIKVTEWDGQFEEPITLTTNKTLDLARLKNGDRVVGKVKSIKDGKLSIEAGSTLLDVPLTRVKQIELAAAKSVAPKTSPATVRAHFASGNGSLTFDLDQWSGGTNAHLGPLKLDPNAFSRLVFDLSAQGVPQ